MKEVTLLGAGSHARAVIALLDECGYKIKHVVDINRDEMAGERINNVPVVGKDFMLHIGSPIVLSIGDNILRGKFFLTLGSILKGNIISPLSSLKSKVEIGGSNQIFANAFINDSVTIKENNIINTGAIIEHESIIGSHNHISIGVVIAGRVNIGNYCFIGANSTIIDKVNICSNVVVGAGSVVLKDITQPGTYVGNPLRKIK